MKRLAYIISRVFDPMIEIPIILSVVVWFALTNGLRFRFFIFLLIVDALIPAGYMVWGIITKRVSDWDMTKRKERAGLYAVTVFCHAFGALYAFFLGKYELSYVLFLMWGLAAVFAVITLFWKISVHAGVNAVMVAYFNHYWGWHNYWWLVIVLVLVLWARLEMKKHTFAQLLVGTVLALVWVEVGLRYLG